MTVHFCRNIKKLKAVVEMQITATTCTAQGPNKSYNIAQGLNESYSVYDYFPSSLSQVQNGSITFADMDLHLTPVAGDEAAIKKELDLIAELIADRTWVQERLKQLNQYHAIQNCQNGAKVIIDFKSTYDIQGDFEPVQRILDLVS